MPPQQRQPLLRISGVTRQYGLITALWKVSFDVYPGDFVTIFGPNGAGKSTLLRVIASLTSPTEGSVTFGEKSGGRDQVGYVSHQSLLYNEMTGLENLVFYAQLFQLQDPVARAGTMLEELGLSSARDQLVRGYSRGMKQRLTLARALLHDPQLLLLDEPYTGLDQHGSRLLTEVLKSIRSDRRTVLLITHNLVEGLELCSRVLIQHKGEIVYQASRAEVSRIDFEKLYFDIVEGASALPGV